MLRNLGVVTDKGADKDFTLAGQLSKELCEAGGIIHINPLGF